MSIALRPAKSEDASAIARICLAAGGGSFEYLFDGLLTGTDSEHILIRLAAARNTPYSFQHFTIAESNGEVIGGVNAMSVPELNEAERHLLPALKDDGGFGPWPLIRYSARRVRLSMRLAGSAIDPASLVLANVAVFPEHTGRGVGGLLVRHVLDHAAREGFASVSLVVWDTNRRARALYERVGFQAVDETAFKPLGNLDYGARVLMVCPIN